MPNQRPPNFSAIPGSLSQDDPAPSMLDYSPTVRPRWAQRITAPLRWLYYLPLTAAFLWLVWIGRYPHSFWARFMCVLLMSVFACTWLFWFSLRHFLLQKYPVPPLPNTCHFRPLQIVMAIGIALVVMLHLEIPSHIAFRLSEPTMRRTAEVLLLKQKPYGFPPSFYWPQHVGLFDFDAITYLPTSRSVYFYLRDGGLFTNTGWTYSPNNPPESPRGEAGPGTQIPYDGPWYRTTLQW